MSTDTKSSGTTLSDVEEMKERRAELADKREDYREREEELSSELAHLHADGESESERAGEIAADRREVRETAADLDAALDVMDDRIVEATEEAAANEAGVEIASLRKRVGGIAGQHEQDVERARELADELITLVRRVEKNRAKQLHYKALAEALADRFEREAGEFKILQETAADLSRLRKRTAKALAADVSLPEWELAGVDLEPGAKALTAAKALRKGWSEKECRAVELLELVDGEIERDLNRVERVVRDHRQAERERKALEWAREYLDSRVNSPVFTNELLDGLKAADPPPTDRRPDKLMAAAARELGLVRVVDESGMHHYAPEGFEPDGSTWRAARPME